MAKTTGGVRGGGLSRSAFGRTLFTIAGGDVGFEEMRQYANMTGLPENFDGEIVIEKYSNGRVAVNIENDDIAMTRYFDPNDKSIKNDYFKIKNKTKYSGSEIFASQVERARKAGYKKIKVHAAGYNGGSMNGYYTWLRFGYVPNDSYQKSRSFIVKAYNREHGTNLQTVQDFMATQRGRDYWKKNGRDWLGEFDLSANSYSSKTLKAYLKSKKRK